MQNMKGRQQHLQQDCILPEELLKQIKEMGVDIARVTLHVGLGTFRPVKVENVLRSSYAF